jgi:hypothetical protein
MGKFVRDAKGEIVAVGGAPILAKTLDRKPRDCEGCGYAKWVKGDRLFIVQNAIGAMEWLCPDCATERGLPEEHYQRNHYAPFNPRIASARQQREEELQRKVGTTSDLAACMCYF